MTISSSYPLAGPVIHIHSFTAAKESFVRLLAVN